MSTKNEDMLEELIKKGESDTLEFKSSMRASTKPDLAIMSLQESIQKAVRQDEKNTLQRKLIDLKKTIMSALEREILRTIAAFMNSKGGILLVGVNDSGEVMGLEKDFETFSDKKNWHGWSQHFVSTVRKHMGRQYMSNIKSESVVFDDKIVALIRIQKSSKPVYVEYQDNKTGEIKLEFYCRFLNTTQLLNVKEASEYVSGHHWESALIQQPAKKTLLQYTVQAILSFQPIL
jgi:predicted HTH transcriptional regulator